MNLFLLDAGGAGLAYLVFGVFIIFIVLAILAEAAIMLLCKFHLGFKKAFIDSLIANLISLGVGFIIVETVGSVFDYDVANLIGLFGITVVVEGICLYLLNRSKPFGRLALTTVAMNVFTYIILGLMTLNQ